MSDFVEYKGSKLFYYKYGAGTKTILLFHGFGQDHTSFDSWIEILKEDYTIYSFDLFFHGESIWPGYNPVEKTDWENIVGLFLLKEKIGHFDLAGFSMGGKFAFATLELFPNRVKKLILVAPDGIKVNFWYRLATYPILMRALFHSFVLRPGIFFSLARLLQSLGIINKYLLRFALLQMNTEEKRRRVYSSWVYFRPLKFEMSDISRLLNQNQIPVKIIVGKFDKVIPQKDMNRLTKLTNQCQLEVIDTGHTELLDKAIGYIK